MRPVMVNKWAAGISDVLPYLNSAQAAHPVHRRSLDQLR